MRTVALFVLLFIISALIGLAVALAGLYTFWGNP